ncbi:MAG: aminopeptidase [Theionarchaea archaeon]|nr:aminopeptidase [Theionarchaea archaeon]
MDPRIVEHAHILVGYSCEVGEGDHVVVTVEDEGIELAREIVRHVAVRGGTTVIVQKSTETERALMDAIPAHGVGFPDHYYEMIKHTDVYIGIRSTANTRALGNVDPDAFVQYQKMQNPIRQDLLKKRWCGTITPTQAFAQEAGMSLSEYENFIYGAIIRNWEKEAELMYRVKEIMDRGKEVTISGKDTNLTLSIEERKAVAATGKHDMPSGEVYTAPVDDSAEGYISFDVPVMVSGSLIEGVRLAFHEGEVVESTAQKGERLLKKVISTDEGSKRLGELGIGTNRGITTFTNNILLDEKIGDTIHLALGNAYPDCRGINVSAIHMDIVKTMKPGQVLIDGEILQKDGKWAWELDS